MLQENSDQEAGPGIPQLRLLVGSQLQPVNVLYTLLKSQVFCVMPEQVFWPRLPGQPPLSR
jgi:hypothetical protein